jgi:hypothetical protein
MKVRYNKNGALGSSDTFNVSVIGEVIVYFDEGGADSMYIKDLDVLIDDKWKDMSQAFKDKDLITDNYNTMFTEPKSEEERNIGYYL